MRSCVRAGGAFPDYSLPDRTNRIRKPSELSELVVIFDHHRVSGHRVPPMNQYPAIASMRGDRVPISIPSTRGLDPPVVPAACSGDCRAETALWSVECPYITAPSAP
jgi:hypothetical protein